MKRATETPPTANHPNVVSGIIARFAQVAAVFLLQALILFLTAGGLNWIWAWIFLGICVMSMVINGSLLIRTNPETVAERGRPKETQSWDKVVSGLWSLALFVVVPLLAGLDFRFSWTGELSLLWNIGGAVVLALGLGLSGWAMIANANFSTAVRIQSDRGQTVCQTGPYRLARHPGYAGFVLQSLATPVVLGSWWALIPGMTAAVLMIIRTWLEDRMLQAELSGYRDYVQHVRYRLLPGVW